MSSPSNPWSTLGRQQKLALARRDPHAMRIHLDHLPHSVRADVLALCDKYAQDCDKRACRVRDLCPPFEYSGGLG